MKNLFRILSIILLLCMHSSVFSQFTFENYYGGIDYEEGSAVAETDDGGFIVVGYTESFGAGGSDFFVVRTAADGDTVWTKTYGGTSSDVAKDIVKLDGGHYMIGGFTSSFGLDEPDIYLIEIDYDGNALWSKTIGTEENEQLNKIRKTSDGGFIICGITEKLSHYKYYIVKTNSSGDTLWTRAYDYGIAEWIEQTDDGGYILVVYPYEPFGVTRYDFQLVKLDSDGETAWSKFYGAADPVHEISFAVQQATDGGYLLAGRVDGYGAGGSDFLILKTDADGDSLWSKTFGGGEDERAFTLINTSDGGYLIGGYTATFGGGYFDFYLVKTDENGDSLWTRTYGGEWQEMVFDVKETSDGGFAAVGYTLSYGAGDYDAYLVRTNHDGVVTAISQPETSFGERPELLQNYPNPFNSSTVISWQSPKAGWQTLIIYDMLGKEVATLVDEYRTAGRHMVKFNADGLASGMYCCKFLADDRTSTINMVIGK
ncbi:MAG: T9SS type A sorting domain-containing protein [Chitinophagales bacterium]|nr:T9SS type A sorting domain-containing protein [Chitinophagales bacterium]